MHVSIGVTEPLRRTQKKRRVRYVRNLMPNPLHVRNFCLTTEYTLRADLFRYFDDLYSHPPSVSHNQRTLKEVFAPTS
jgi:hypothetical protein